MKYVAFGLLAMLALSGLNPAQAQYWRDGSYHQYRADRQQWKANRDAAMGDFYGAAHHQRRAMRQQFRADRNYDRGFYRSY